MKKCTRWTKCVRTVSLAGVFGLALPPAIDAADPPQFAPPARQPAAGESPARQPATRQPAQQPPGTASPGSPPAAQPPQSAPAATVNGEPISEAEVQSRLQMQLQGQNVTAEMMDQVRQQVLESLIDTRLVEQYALENSPEVDAKIFEGVLANVRQQLEGQGTTLSQYLQTRGQDEDSFRRQIQASIAWQQLLAEETSPEKLKAYFSENKEQFDGTQVRARHILVSLPPGAEESQQQAALEKLQKIRAALEEGNDFAAVAQQASDDSGTAAQGGDVGYFPRRGRMIEPFAEAAFRMKAGEISEPVQTQLGLHLIQVTDRRSGNKSFEEAQSELATARTADLWNQIVEQMRSRAEIRLARPERQGAARGGFESTVR